MITRPTLPLWPVRGIVMPFSSGMIAHRVRRLAVRHAPLDHALVEIHRREHAVRRLRGSTVPAPSSRPRHRHRHRAAAAATLTAACPERRSARRPAWPGRRRRASARAPPRWGASAYAPVAGREALAELLPDHARLIGEIGSELRAAEARRTRPRSSPSPPSRTRCASRDRSRRRASSVPPLAAPIVIAPSRPLTSADHRRRVDRVVDVAVARDLLLGLRAQLRREVDQIVGNVHRVASAHQRGRRMRLRRRSTTHRARRPSAPASRRSARSARR